jgi:hypothetical protein
MKPDLEQEMKDADWFVTKVKDSEIYAQNLYAALCNNAFQKLEVMSVLTDDVWSCSWRYAGGIVADLRGEGDYLDWYCSGIRGGMTYEDVPEDYGFVGESVVTLEVRQDLKQLGWIVIDDYFDDPI